MRESDRSWVRDLEVRKGEVDERVGRRKENRGSAYECAGTAAERGNIERELSGEYK